MRIGILVCGFPVLSETFVANDVRGLEALGHDVTVFALEAGDPAAEGNPNYAIRGSVVPMRGIGRNGLWRKVQKLSARRGLRRRYGERLERWLNERPAGMPDRLWIDRLTWEAAIEQIDTAQLDFLHVHFGMRQLLLGYHASRLLEVPLGVTLHAHDIFVNPLAAFFPQLLGQCSLVTTVSEYNKAEILRLALELPPERVKVAAMGIDVGRFSPKPHDPCRPFRFCATGRLVEIKGFQVLVEAVGVLAKRRSDFCVRVVGDGPMRAQLSARVAELGIEQRIEFLGRRDASFLRVWLPDQDCFVLPCVIAKDGNRDGTPVAIREAMACGLPAISTDILGLRETVTPETGMLVPSNDPAALAEAMGRVIDLPIEEYRAMASVGRAKAEAEFSLEREVGLLEGWMKEVKRET